eukprot:1157433-Pelagomonas_calceolata.AAC.3
MQWFGQIAKARSGLGCAECSKSTMVWYGLVRWQRHRAEEVDFMYPKRSSQQARCTNTQDALAARQTDKQGVLAARCTGRQMHRQKILMQLYDAHPGVVL